MEQTPSRIDYFQRFLRVPYIFSVKTAGATMRIESNDLEIALAIRGVCLSSETSKYAPILDWIVLRDYKTSSSGYDVALLTDGNLRTLLVGQDAILVFDSELRKVLGFVNCWIDMPYLITELLPLLVVE